MSELENILKSHSDGTVLKIFKDYYLTNTTKLSTSIDELVDNILPEVEEKCRSANIDLSVLCRMDPSKFSQSLSKSLSVDLARDILLCHSRDSNFSKEVIDFVVNYKSQDLSGSGSSMILNAGMAISLIVLTCTTKIESSYIKKESIPGDDIVQIVQVLGTIISDLLHDEKDGQAKINND